MSFSSENKVYNIVWFQAVWWGMVYLQQYAIIGGLLLVGLHFALMESDRINELFYSFVVAALGLGMDSFLAWYGILNFRPGEIFNLYPPVWLMVLWISFSCTLRFSLKTIISKLWLAVPLGGLGGAGSYIAGAKLGVLELGADLSSSGPVLVGVWACLFALFSVGNRLFDEL